VESPKKEKYLKHNTAMYIQINKTQFKRWFTAKQQEDKSTCKFSATSQAKTMLLWSLKKNAED